MKCIGCKEGSDGYAVIPGIGEAGEIRFFCDACARGQKVKMRYWDGRDLDIGGHRDHPDLGSSFSTLIFSFDDVARMRPADIAAALDWVEDLDLAAALAGAPQRLLVKAMGPLTADRARRVRGLMGKPSESIPPPEAQGRIVDVIRRL